MAHLREVPTDNKGKHEDETDKLMSLEDSNLKRFEKKSPLSFEELMKRNRQNQERLREERNKANISVIRSYRLKK